jgi:hypothetical protein
VKPRIAVDFDNTIYDGVGLLPGCLESLAELQKTYSIAIFSARSTAAEINEMNSLLIRFRVPYDEILPPKPNCEFYIDDKGVCFTSWDKVILPHPTK